MKKLDESMPGIFDRVASQIEKPVQVTELELEVLRNICKSEYHSAATLLDAIDFPVWSFTVTDERKELAGALGSLVKKGLVVCEKESGEDETCCITRKGFEVLVIELSKLVEKYKKDTTLYPGTISRIDPEQWLNNKLSELEKRIFLQTIKSLKLQ